MAPVLVQRRVLARSVSLGEKRERMAGVGMFFCIQRTKRRKETDPSVHTLPPSQPHLVWSWRFLSTADMRDDPKTPAKGRRRMPKNRERVGSPVPGFSIGPKTPVTLLSLCWPWGDCRLLQPAHLEQGGYNGMLLESEQKSCRVWNNITHLFGVNLEPVERMMFSCWFVGFV